MRRVERLLSMSESAFEEAVVIFENEESAEIRYECWKMVLKLLQEMSKLCAK